MSVTNDTSENLTKNWQFKYFVKSSMRKKRGWTSGNFENVGDDRRNAMHTGAFPEFQPEQNYFAFTKKCSSLILTLNTYSYCQRASDIKYKTLNIFLLLQYPTLFDFLC